MNRVRARIRSIIYDMRTHGGNGFFHVFFGNILSQAVYVLGPIVLTNIFANKADYGLLTYIMSTVNIVILFAGLGQSAMVVLHCATDVSEQKASQRFKLAMGTGMKFNTLLLAVAMLFFILLPEDIIPGSKIIPYLLPIVLLRFPLDMVQNYLRARLQFKSYAIVAMLTSSVFITCVLIGAKLHGLMGYIYAQYIAFGIVLIIAAIIAKPNFDFTSKLEETDKFKKLMLTRGGIIMLNNSASMLMYRLDSFILGLMFVANMSIVADYNIAVIIPNTLRFLPASIMIYLYPYIAKNRHDIPWIKATLKKLLVYDVLFVLAMCAAMLLLGAFAISLIYDPSYLTAMPMYRILVIAFFFTNTIRLIFTQTLSAMHKQTVVLINTLVCLLMNIILNIWFINVWGANGAAIATAVSMAFSGIFAFIMLQYYFKIGSKTNNTKDVLDEI